MKVLKITPRGYCQGVTEALELVKQTLNIYSNQPIYLLGMIVHNQLIHQALIDNGVIVLDESRSKQQWVASIDKGVIIISAHGISPTLLKQIKDKNLIIVDATCAYVKITANLVQEYILRNYRILFIGQKNHPETMGIWGIDPNTIDIISTIEDIERLPYSDTPLVVMTQTTANYQTVEFLFQAILTKYPNAIIESEICNATRMRQQAIINIEEHVDVLYVVGDTSSNNANRLVEIGQTKGIASVFLVQSLADIDTSKLSTTYTVAVTSAASTPTILTQQIIDYLENFPQPKQPVNLKKIF